MRFILFILLLSMSALISGCQNSAAPTSIKPIANNTPQAAKPKAAPATHDGHDHAADQNAPRISLADSKKAFDAGNAIFVDTRYADAFQIERIKGAINIPANQFETAHTKIPTGKTIIAYCS